MTDHEVSKAEFPIPKNDDDETMNATTEEPDPTAKPSGTEAKIRKQVTECLEKISVAQERAASLRAEANLPDKSPAEAEDLIRQAIEQEKIAASQNKTVKRLQSGVWQGGLAGGGIGTGIGMGIGTVLGTVVGGVASVPFGGLGLLGGAATGAVHGPWFLKKKKKGEEGNVEGETEGDEGDGEEDELVEVVQSDDGGLETAHSHEKIVEEGA